MGQYDVGLLVGRAFALANGRGAPTAERAVAELRALAQGDHVALEIAHGRFLEFLHAHPDSVEDRRALRLLDAVLRQSADGDLAGAATG